MKRQPAAAKTPQRKDTRIFSFDFTDKTYVMGVLNVTPDSFSDGGKFFDTKKAFDHGMGMVEDGADIIDVGGESTRPGAGDVSAEEELDRVIPVIEKLSKNSKALISIDTRKAKVAEGAIKSGARIINDISGLRHDKEMASVAARHATFVIAMHMKGAPRDMQTNPTYKNLIKELLDSLRQSIRIAENAGIKKDRIIIDPGIGFGKTLEHNLEILNRLSEFKVLNHPICIGTSRKSFIGKTLNISNTEDRLVGSIATAVIAVMKGANILRVHDVRETLEAIRMTESVLRAG